MKQLTWLGRLAGAFGLVPPAGLFFMAHAHMLPAAFMRNLSLVVVVLVALEVVLAVALVAKLVQMVRRDWGTTYKPERPVRPAKAPAPVPVRSPAALPARAPAAIEAPRVFVAGVVLERRDEVTR